MIAKNTKNINKFKKREEQILTGTVNILIEHLPPSKIVLFGSRSKGKNGKHADFDVAIDCKKPTISIQRKINAEIETISGLFSVDIIYMQSVDKDFMEIILTTGRVIYDK